MPDVRSHRGSHPEDAALFAPERWPALQEAAGELAWLLDRGYALRSSLALVGDRHALTQRQRLALARGSTTARQCAGRAAREVAPADLAGRDLWIDGYNLLITIEAALAGGILLHARDGCYRDMASLHGSYRRVDETEPALRLIGGWLIDHQVGSCRWILDRPVGNSGRLRAMMETLARSAGWRWQVELESGPDAVLARAPGVVASSDSVVLDRCAAWCNLARHVVVRSIPTASVLRLDPAAPTAGPGRS